MPLRWLAAALAAVCAGVPLVGPEVWSGFRLGWSDPVLSVVAATEQPLSLRSQTGVWAMALALVWWGLAYRSRSATLWEAALVLLGGAAALVRLGNAWLYGAALIVPLARQFWLANAFVREKAPLLGLCAAASLAVGALVIQTSRPPDIGDAALDSAVRPGTGDILADWRWAPQIQRHLGPSRLVLAAGGLTSESADFWLDYVRIAQGHERWADDLQRLNVDVVVLDSSDQQRAASALIRASSDWQVVYDADGALVAERTAR